MHTELRAAVNSLPPLSPPLVGWQSIRQQLRHRLVEDDPADFMGWSVIQATMQTAEAPYTVKEKAGAGYVLSCLPFDYQAKPAVIHQAYHLQQWLDKGHRINELSSVVEIGGGYGEMARLFRMLGYRGEYRLYDFPELLLLQKYYLETSGVFDITFTTEMPKRADLLVALWSLSEIAHEERDRLVDDLAVSHLLIGYHDFWDEVDNNDYFENWPGERHRIAHLPGNHYLVL